MHQPRIDQISSPEKVLKLQELVERVEVNDGIYEHIVEIVAMTRKNNNLLLGASPRATLHLLNVSRAAALLSSRGHIIADDVKFMLPHVLNHRLILKPEAELDGLTTFEVINQISREAKVSEHARS